MNDERDKRRSFRVTEWVHLDYEVISDREFHEGRARRNARLGGVDGLCSTLLDLDARLAEKLYLLRASAGAVAECISILNDKLTAVVERLPELRQQKTSLAAREPLQCELGADGISFGTGEAIAPGRHLAIRFLLGATHRYIETFGTVVRQVPPPDPEDARHAHGVVVEFYGLEAPQREVIIHHLFSREAETLRERRLRADS